MTTVLCHGTFRVLHYGHFLHLEEASKIGDRLIVSITSDQFIKKPGGAVHSDEQREHMLRSLRFVDDVYICYAPTGMRAIIDVHPDIYCKGIDYEIFGPCWEEQTACRQLNVKILTTTTEKFSTGDILRKLCAS
jgi:cytidyltransferase-like protein